MLKTTMLLHLLKQIQVPKDVFRGRVLWVQRCALCHDGVGQPSYRTVGPWLDADTVKALGEPALRAIIAAGRLKPGPEKSLADDYLTRAQGLGVEVHIAGVEHEHLHANCMGQSGEQLVIPPGGLHGHAGPRGQPTQPGADRLDLVGDGDSACLTMAGDDQFGLGHIYTYKHLTSCMAISREKQ